ncbi:hypothetical protein PV646_28485 [Streptomyces sp. ID05-26A]|nr:hypothetical protein [Streptomyces sp. ID05-26A]
MTTPTRFRPYWGRITAAVLGSIAIGTAPSIVTGEWRNALGALALIAVGLVAAWIGYSLGHANARAERAFQVEAARQLHADDPDPFNTQLTVEPRTSPTDTTGETR